MTSIWMAPEDPYTSAVFAPGSCADFMNLFTDAGAWQQVSSDLSVFKLYAGFVDNATDAQLQEIGTWAQQNHIQLAMETGVLPTSAPGQPGWGVEGYNGAVVGEVQRLTSLGINLSYIAMDEPLYFGQQWSGPNAAHASTATLASQAAATIAQLQQIDPTLQFGDIEPIPQTSGIDGWISALQADTGQKLAFFDADVNWGLSYQVPLADLASTLRTDGITYGVIIDGNGNETSDASWTTDALTHLLEIESNPALAADQYVFQTWNPYPTETLSDTTPGTLTSLMLQGIQILNANPATAVTTPNSAPTTGSTPTPPASTTDPMPETWNGGAGDFATDADWTSGLAPDSGSDVAVGAGSDVSVSGTQGAATLQLASGAELDVPGSLTIGGGTSTSVLAGDVQVAPTGSLALSGPVELDGTLDLAAGGSVSVAGDLTGTGSVSGAVLLADGTLGAGVTLAAGSLAGNGEVLAPTGSVSVTAQGGTLALASPAAGDLSVASDATLLLQAGAAADTVVSLGASLAFLDVAAGQVVDAGLTGLTTSDGIDFLGDTATVSYAGGVATVSVGGDIVGTLALAVPSGEVLQASPDGQGGTILALAAAPTPPVPTPPAGTGSTATDSGVTSTDTSVTTGTGPTGTGAVTAGPGTVTAPTAPADPTTGSGTSSGPTQPGTATSGTTAAPVVTAPADPTTASGSSGPGGSTATPPAPQDGSGAASTANSVAVTVTPGADGMAGAVSVAANHDQVSLVVANGALALTDATGATTSADVGATGTTLVQFDDGTAVVDPSGIASDIARVYQAALGRTPDVGGLQYWTNAVDGGQLSLAGVATALLSSPESIAGGIPSDPDFVTLTYENVLGRAPDAAGQQFWTQGLADGSLTQAALVTSVATSAEAQVDMMGTDGSSLAGQAATLYEELLGRAPDPSGLQFWVGSLQAGQSEADLATQVMASPEYLAEHGGQDDADFVASLYQNGLGRAPDSGGLAYWTGVLADGTGRAEVAGAFLGCAEVQGKAAADAHAGWVWIGNG